MTNNFTKNNSRLKKLFFFLSTLSILFVILIFSFITPVLNTPVKIYLSPSGADDNTGSKMNPLLTFDAVNKKIKTLLSDNKFSSDIEIILKEGTYNINNSIIFDFTDLDSYSSKITMHPYKDEKVLITSGYELSTDQFTPVAEITNYEIPDYLLNRNNVYIYSLEDMNIAIDYLTDDIRDFPQLYFNNEPLTLARYPNTDFLSIDNAVYNNETGAYTIKYSDQYINELSSYNNLYLEGYLFHNWNFSTNRINTINSYTNEINITDKIQYGVSEDARFFIANSLYALDTSGEYYIDYENKLLYLIAPDNFKEGTLTLSTQPTPLVNIINASNFTIDNINFSNCLSNGIRVNDSSNITISNCSFYNFSSTAVIILNGYNHNIKNNKLSNIGASGIYVEAGDRNTLTSSNSTISGNTIQNFAGLYRTYSAAIGIYGVGITCKDNKITDGPHCGILFWGNDHLIENNEISHIAKETDDVGAIYSGRDWSFRGNVIKDNYLHDINSSLDRYGAWGIYLDDCLGGTTITNNKIEKCDGGIEVSNGSYNTITNNLFINCKKSLRYFQLASTYDYTQLYTNLEKVDYTSDIWKKKYPELISYISGNPNIPTNNVIKNNKYFNSSPFDIADSILKNSDFSNNVELDSYSDNK